MPTPYIMIKTEVDVTEISYIHSICIVPPKKISFFQRRINRKVTVCCLRTVLLTIYHSLRGFGVPATAIQKQQPM